MLSFQYKVLTGLIMFQEIDSIQLTAEGVVGARSRTIIPSLLCTAMTFPSLLVRHSGVKM